MSEKRFKSTLDEDTMSIMPYLVSDNEECFYNLEGCVDLLNEQQATIQFLQNEIDELKKDIDIYKYEEKKHSETARKLYEENEQLKQKIQRWKNLYDIKDNEVTARVDALNEVCEYYLTEAQFKADTDPNEAVHEVINRILNTEVKW